MFSRLIQKNVIRLRGCSRGFALCTKGLIQVMQECKNITQGRQLHAEITASGYEQDRLIRNHIVQMYGKCGSIDDAKEAFRRIVEKNVFSWNVMLVAFAENGALEEAQYLFERMPMRNPVGWTTMLTANAKCGHLYPARELFDNMPFKGPVAWGAMMSAYSQNGHSNEAFIIFRRMDQEGEKPTEVIYVIALDACSFSQGEYLHDRLAYDMLHRQPKVGSSLMSMYNRFRRLEQTRTIFREMPVRNTVSWNIMISAYARNADFDEAFVTFRSMQMEGTVPGKVTFLSILEACVDSRHLEEVRHLQKLMTEAGLEQDVVLATAIVTMYGKCGSVTEARSVFERMPERSVVTWTGMITVYSQACNPQLAMKVFRTMQLEGVTPNEVTLVSLLDAFAVPSSLAFGKEVHAVVVGSLYLTVVKVCNSLITMYGKCGGVREAEEVFEVMPLSYDSVTWTSMVATYAYNKRGTDAVSLFHRMELEGVKAMRYTYTSLLEACGEMKLQGSKRLICSVLERLQLDNLDSDVPLGNLLLNTYGRLGCLQEAESVFAKISLRSVITWTTMIELYVCTGRPKDAIKTFLVMDLEGSKGNEVTFISAIDACAELTSLGIGQLLHSELSQVGLVLGNSLMSMYAKCGNLNFARDVFHKMANRDEVSWNTIVAAYAHIGGGTQTLKLFHEMNLCGLSPNEITFSSVLCACGHKGLVNEGFQHFVSISYDFCQPSVFDHYVCMVEVLARGGRVEDGADLIENMPYEPDAKVWVRLLSACRMEGDVKRAKLCADRFCQLNPHDTSAFVLLSNTYSQEHSLLSQ